MDKPRYQTRLVKYAFGNKPDEATITRLSNQMYEDGYRLTGRTEKSAGCLGAISSTLFGGGQTSLTFELMDAQ